jgi:histidine triad (HIT) family protein
MSTLFTKIIEGEIPGTFVWKDDICVAFLSIHPLRPGHTLVVPRKEVDHWIDLDLETLEHVMAVSQAIGEAIQHVYRPAKVGQMIAGLEVPHTHIHLVPIDDVHDLDFENQDTSATREDLVEEAAKIEAAIEELGLGEVPGTGGGISG